MCFCASEATKLKSTFLGLTARVLDVNKVPPLDALACYLKDRTETETPSVLFVAGGKQCQGNASVQSPASGGRRRYKRGECHTWCSRPNHYISLEVFEKHLWWQFLCLPKPGFLNPYFIFFDCESSALQGSCLWKSLLVYL